MRIGLIASSACREGDEGRPELSPSLENRWELFFCYEEGRPDSFFLKETRDDRYLPLTFAYERRRGRI